MAQDATYDQVAAGRPEARKPSIWSALPSFQKSWPGLLAMAVIGVINYYLLKWLEKKDRIED